MTSQNGLPKKSPLARTNTNLGQIQLQLQQFLNESYLDYHLFLSLAPLLLLPFCSDAREDEEGALEVGGHCRGGRPRGRRLSPRSPRGPSRGSFPQGLEDGQAGPETSKAMREKAATKAFMLTP